MLTQFSTSDNDAKVKDYFYIHLTIWNSVSVEVIRRKRYLCAADAAFKMDSMF